MSKEKHKKYDFFPKKECGFIVQKIAFENFVKLTKNGYVLQFNHVFAYLCWEQYFVMKWKRMKQINLQICYSYSVLGW